MFPAAKTSRSCSAPHVHSHVRSDNFSSWFIIPQTLQVRLLGSNLPIFRRFFPLHSHLYSSCLKNSLHETSEIACAKQWFFMSPAMFKSSTAILSTWFSLVSRCVNLCRKSFRLLLIFSWNFATFKTAFFLFELPFFFLLARRCSTFNRESSFLRCFGFSTFSPVDSVQKSLIPTSMPIVPASVITGFPGISSGVSTKTETKYLPVVDLETVKVLVSPSNRRDILQRIPSRNLGIISLPASRLICPRCGTWKDCRWFFFLNLGNLVLCLKKFIKALSKFIKDACKDCALTSASHGLSDRFISGNWSCNLYRDRDSPVFSYALIFSAKAQLKISRVQPKCLSSRVACALFG